MTDTTHAPTISTLAGFMSQREWIGNPDEAKTFRDEVPRDEALKLLSFPVAESTVTHIVIDDDGVHSIPDPTRKGIVRLDTGEVFSIFKSGYKIHHYPEWLVTNVDALLDGGLSIGTVALTKGGARAFLQAELPDDRYATAPGAEPVRNRPHITVATSMDGSIATTYGVGTCIIICENELGLRSLRDRDGLLGSFTGQHKIRHTSNSLGRILEIRADLGLIVEEIGDAFDREFYELVSQHVSDAKWNELVASFTGWKSAKEGRALTMATAKRDALNNLWHNDERAAPWKNSAYGVVAAFNTAAHHVFGADKNRTERNQNRTIEGGWAEQADNVLRMLATV